ncbi:Rhodanese-related sulfurtransferase [Alkalispirochaeta americana]|uniref:Rhodanese-related sulfurtransferase n=1 Tax=Alkalispirochaeta americana TaxID=159291 RepID=A0A1N6SGK1_9SPIO|nr:rhodanese-like domain-containing protein [Alkalispirochaeta americana]SIQ40056.1 Rhodanese-related sulfurtransferase [Alkalispirochaeta americana]
MTKSIFLNTLVIAVTVAFAAAVALPAQEPDSALGDPRDVDVLAGMINDPPSGFLLLDVRTQDEYENGHIPAALHRDLQVLEEEMAQGDRTQLVVLYCRSGRRSAEAARVLRSLGYQRVYDFGALHRWTGALSS